MKNQFTPPPPPSAVCRICGGSAIFDQEIGDVVAVHQVVKDAPFVVPTRNIRMFRCEQCGHFQIDNTIDDDFYEEYLMDAFQDNALYLDARFAKLADEQMATLKKQGTGSGKLLDIGCGTGNYLKKAAEHFGDCIGIEPSRSAYSVAKNAGFQVVNAYFDESFGHENEFDAFTTLQVFEHLADPVAVLKDCKKILKPGGVGLINVPDGYHIMNTCLYHQITTEHVNYYTASSLVQLASRAGFEVLEIRKVDFAYQLDMYVRKPKSRSTLNEKKKDDASKISEYLSGCSKVAIWGAGAKSFKYIRLISTELKGKIHHILDSLPDRHGKYITNLDLPIENVRAEVINDSDAVIIFASSYNDEIIKSLKEKYSFTETIVIFQNEEVLCLK